MSGAQHCRFCMNGTALKQLEVVPIKNQKLLTSSLNLGQHLSHHSMKEEQECIQMACCEVVRTQDFHC